MRVIVSIARCVHCGAIGQACRCTGSSPFQWKATAGLAAALYVVCSVFLVLSLAEVYVPTEFVLVAAVAFVAAIAQLGRMGLRCLSASGEEGR